MIEEYPIEDYNIQNIAENMDVESYGVHISLIESGVTDDGKQKMGLIIGTNLDTKKMVEVLKGIVRGYDSINDAQ